MNIKTLFGFALVIPVVIIALVTGLKADTGWDNAARKEEGSFIAIRQITVSSTTGTAIWAYDTKRPDSVCRNNSTAEVWIGTTSATMNNVTHSNITNGFFFKSSETFSLGGSMSGTVYATMGGGVASGDIRCFDGQVP